MKTKKYFSPETRKKLSEAMKATWAARKEAKAVDLRPSLTSLCEAAVQLNGNDDFKLGKAIINHVPVHHIVSALEDYRGAGTNLHDNLRKILVEHIRQAIEK